MYTPKVVVWFRVYCAVMILVYIAVAVLGGWVASNPSVLTSNNPNPSPTSSMPTSQEEALFVGVIYCGMGAFFAIVHIVPFLLPRRFGVWVFSIVVIALGMTSCLTWPATIPLLIFWVRKETREWFKNPTANPAGYHDEIQPYA